MPFMFASYMADTITTMGKERGKEALPRAVRPRVVRPKAVLPRGVLQSPKAVQEATGPAQARDQKGAKVHRVARVARARAKAPDPVQPWDREGAREPLEGQEVLEGREVLEGQEVLEPLEGQEVLATEAAAARERAAQRVDRSPKVDHPDHLAKEKAKARGVGAAARREDPAVRVVRVWAGRRVGQRVRVGRRVAQAQRAAAVKMAKAKAKEGTINQSKL